MEIIGIESIQILPGTKKVIVTYRAAKDVTPGYQMYDVAEFPFSVASDALVKDCLIRIRTKNNLTDISEPNFPTIASDVSQGK